MYDFSDKGQVIAVTITEEPLGVFAKVKFAYGTYVEGFWNETEFRKAIMEKCDGYTLWEDKRTLDIVVEKSFKLGAIWKINGDDLLTMEEAIKDGKERVLD
jgi:hypothetical protein